MVNLLDMIMAQWLYFFKKKQFNSLEMYTKIYIGQMIDIWALLLKYSSF